MNDLYEYKSTDLSQIPLPNIQIRDIRIEIAPSEFPLLPVIRIEANLDIRIGL